MKWLLWREYRLNLLILNVAAFLLVVPYVIAAILLCVIDVRVFGDRPVWVPVLGGAAYYSIFLNQLVLGLLGGNAFAGERSDGSAEFMAYMPVSRRQRLVSKLALAGILALVIWGLNAAVLGLAWPFADPRFVGEAAILALFAAMTGITFYCVSWLISAIQSVPTFAVAAGLLAPFLLVATLQSVAWLVQFAPFTQRDIAVGYILGCILMCLISFPVGTWYYLRRIEP